MSSTFLLATESRNNAIKILVFFVTFVFMLPNACAFFPLCQVAWAENTSLNMQKKDGDSLRSLTVEDVIGMTTLIDPDEGESAYLNVSHRFKFSPDRHYFAIVTRRGNLTTIQNEVKLILYKSDEILHFINDESKKTRKEVPAGKILVRFSHTSNEKGIHQVKWSEDSRTLYFIGINEKEDDKVQSTQKTGQIYSIDICSGRLRQLTKHPRSVIAFDISPTSNRIIYASTVPLYSDARDQSHYLLKTKSFYETMNTDRALNVTQAQYYTLEIGQKGPARAIGRPFLYYAPKVWLSPDSRWAVAILMPDKYRGDWIKNYEPIANLQYFLEFDENTMTDQSDVFWQFALIDIQKGTVTPILDAPNGQFFGGGRVDVRWLPDGESVILANTFLPLDAEDPKENARRRQSPSTIEFNVETKKITRIVEHVVPKKGRRAIEWYAGMDLAHDGTLTIQRMRGRYELPPIVYVKREEKWHELEVTTTTEIQSTVPRLTLTIHQDLNTPPDILARDNQTGREILITDLNPQFNALTLGKVTPFEWIDKAGKIWLGGLVYPPNSHPRKRYPLVIQTHGFQANHFLIEGPPGLTGPYAAQALANKGILVLQIPDSAIGAEEREVTRLGIEAAIDALDDKGLVDRQRVGLIGFSGTGHIVMHVIIFSDYNFAAATIADAFSISMSGYVSGFGQVPPGMAQVERLHKAVPWGDALMDWVASNPAMHLDRVKTPLRLENYSEKQENHWWDIYTLLRRQQKPVEGVVIRDGKHNLVKPMERYIIQQGNVDWYTFWLKGEEDLDPTKASQYTRWRKLREQQEKSESAAIASRARDREMASEKKSYEKWRKQNSQTTAGKNN